IVPYDSFQTADGEIVIAVGNDAQFARFCDIIGRKDLKEDERFKTNKERVTNRELLIPLINEQLTKRSTQYWYEQCEANNIPSGPIQNLEQVYQDEHLAHREMFIEMEHPKAGTIEMIGNPIKLSRTPVTYRKAPPELGQHAEKHIKIEQEQQTEHYFTRCLKTLTNHEYKGEINMDFNFSEEQKMLRQTVRNYVDKEIMPYINECDRQGSFPDKIYQDLAE